MLSLHGLNLPPDCGSLADQVTGAAGCVLAKLRSRGAGFRVSGSTILHSKVSDSSISADPSTLQRDAFLLTWALSPLASAGVSLRDVTLLNISAGGGGERSLLARELGIGRIVHHNPFEGQCDAAVRAGGATGLSADHYLACGDDVLALLRDGAWGVGPSAIVSYDALEHTYNVGRYLTGVIEAADGAAGPLSLALGSGANPCNGVVRRRVMREQVEAEVVAHPGAQGRNDHAGESSTSSPSSPWRSSPEVTPSRSRETYRMIRRRLINEAAPELRPQQVDLLVGRTRGMRSDDILRAVDRLRSIGEYPAPPRHPTNTCDPVSGNGCAQLLDPHVLATVLTAGGVTSRVLPGYYASDADASPLRRWTRRAANAAIRAGGSLAVRYAPFYCIHGSRGV